MEYLYSRDDEFRIPKGCFLSDSLTELTLLDIDSKIDFGGNVIEEGSIPGSVHSLKIDHRFFKNDPIRLIPSSVTDLFVYNWFSCQGDTDLIPSTVRMLSIERLLDPLNSAMAFSPGCFPSGLTSLSIPRLQTIQIQDGVIPRSVKKFKIISRAELKTGAIPDTVEDLTIFKYERIFSPGIIPNGVKSMCVDFYSSTVRGQVIVKGSFPESLEKLVALSLAPSFLSLLEEDEGDDSGLVPRGLKHLETFERWSPKTKLPPTLTYLYCNFDTIKVGLLPPTLKTLIIQSELKVLEIGSIPDSLTEFEHFLALRIPIVEGMLPESITTLKITVPPTIPFPFIPNSVKYLKLDARREGKEYLEVPDGSLPDSIEKIIFFGSKIRIPSGLLPRNIKHLEFNPGNGVLSLINFIIPPTINYITYPLDLSVDIVPNLLSSNKVDKDTVLPQYFTRLADTGKLSPLFYKKEYFKQINSAFSDSIIEALQQQQQQSLDLLSVAFRSQDEADQIFKIIKNFTKLTNLKILIGTVDELFIRRGSIPAIVKELTISTANNNVDSFRYEKCLEHGSIPMSVTDLTINNRFFKHDLTLVPPSVSNLSISHWVYDIEKDKDADMIPRGVKTLLMENGNIKSLSPNFFRSCSSSLVELRFGSAFEIEDPIMPGDLPSSIKDLNMGYYNLPLVPGSIPSSVESLFIVADNYVIPPGVIPNGTKNIELDFQFYEESMDKESIPSSVNRVEFINPPYGLAINELLPSHTLTHLIIGSQIMIEDSTSLQLYALEYLECHFKRITFKLFEKLQCLRHVQFLSGIRHFEPGSLPESVTRIDFCKEIKLNLPSGSLPSRLKHLKFDRISPTVLFPGIPSTVETLILNLASYPKDSTSSRVLPLNLKNLSLLYLNSDIESYGFKIPNTLQKLSIKTPYFSKDKKSQEIQIIQQVYSFRYEKCLEHGSIPMSVTQLTLGTRFFKHDLTLVPTSVPDLIIDNWFYDKEKDKDADMIPRGVKTLFIEYGRIKSLSPNFFRSCSSSLIELWFGPDVEIEDPIMPGDLPFSIKSISLQSNIQLVPGSIPYSVETLSIDADNYVILPGIIPNSVKSIKLDLNNSKDFIDKESIPSSVEKLLLISPHYLSKINEILPIDTRDFHNLKHLTIGGLIKISDSTSLPLYSLEYLECHFKRITIKIFEKLQCLKQIRFLSGIKYFSQGSLPQSVTRIDFCKEIEINMPKGSLPPRLKHLKFDTISPRVIFPVIPSTVEILKLNLSSFPKDSTLLPELDTNSIHKIQKLYTKFSKCVNQFII
eukprot:gene5499-6851_t